MSPLSILCLLTVVVVACYGACETSWIENPIGDTCYFFSSDKLPWAEAKTACEAKGANLVAFETMGEVILMKGIRHHYSKF